MVELIPAANGVGREAIQRVIEGLCERGVEAPAMIFVDRADDPWRVHAARTSVDLRRRSVIVLASSSSLVDAVRFEFGGAARLPASSVSMESAFDAATRCPLSGTPIATRGVVDAALGGAKRVAAVGWRRARFWRSHVGTRVLSNYLADVAARLGCVPAVVPGPILLAPDRERAGIRDAIEETAAGYATIAPPSIVPIDPILSALDIGVEGVAGDSATKTFDAPQPVLELPSGRRVGTWSLAGDPPPGLFGWFASPERISASASSWTLQHPDGSQGFVADSPALSDQLVVKVPGWMSDHLCPGSPAGRLVEALAEDPGRFGRPLWVSNADADGVRFLLGLPGPIWVDGPGVPVD